MLKTPYTRRRFVQGIALGGTGLGLLCPGLAGAATNTDSAPPLQGNDIHLTIAETPVNLTGRTRLATTVNGGVPGPLLRLREGETVTLRVSNQLRVSTSIHWHGLLLPANMDGVPGLSFDGIAPGGTFTYRFPLRQAGTYWYHGHSRFQEQTGIYGALIIDPIGHEPHPADREHVLLFSDWSDEDPEHIFRTLKRMSSYYNYNKPTVMDFLSDARTRGLGEAIALRRMWNQMRMSPTDLADVSGHTYTYLLNGQSPASNWTGLFRPGERVRLRLINGSAQSFFDVRIPGLALTVVAMDGQPVEAVTVDELRLAAAETCDVIVTPSEDRAYTVFAQSLDRSGYARGTLAPRLGMIADVPALDAPVWLDMRDMMGDMGNMPSGDAHAHHHMAGHDMSSMGMPDSTSTAVTHVASEYGPNVDMRVDIPRENLDDPGTGLRNNGRRVLTYADLHSLPGIVSKDTPEREIELHLTGNMERFVWSFNGIKGSDAEPIRLRLGERVRFVLVNDTMMNHPIHLHGLWSDLEQPDGSPPLRKHTVNVQPAQRVRFVVHADTPGRWAFHCHLLYHMEAGMFREVVVS
jgi:CopA family copper-resistance protein